MERVRVVWAITGAGDYLVESMEVVKRIKRDLGLDVTVVLSENGKLVVQWYGLWDQLQADFDRVMTERGANQPFLAGPLQVGRYAWLLVSPATSNSVAKIVYGIADSLITNCVAQTIKGGTPVYVYPVDRELGTVETRGPQGEEIVIKTRRIDVENTDRLRKMDGITVLDHPSEMEAAAAAAVH